MQRPQLSTFLLSCEHSDHRVISSNNGASGMTDLTNGVAARPNKLSILDLRSVYRVVHETTSVRVVRNPNISI